MRSRIRVSILVAVTVFAIIALLQVLGRLQGTENVLLSLRFELRGEREPSPTVVVLASKMPESEQGFAGPWTTRSLAGLVSRLDAAGASVIALDVPGLAAGYHAPAGEEDTAKLAAAMRAHGRVVLPLLVNAQPTLYRTALAAVTRFSCGRGELLRPKNLRPGHLGAPPKTLCQAAAGLGSTNVYPDTDAVVREAPLMVSWKGHLYPSFWLEVLRVHDGAAPGSAQLLGNRVTLGQRTFETDDEAEVIVNYAGGYEHFPRVRYPAMGRWTDEELRERVQGKIVLVGSDLAGFTSYLRTPTAPMMPGVEVTANILNSLIQGSTLGLPAAWLQHLGALLLALLTAWLVARRGPVGGFLLTLVVLVGVAALGLGLFMLDICVPLAEPLLVAALVGGLLVADTAAIADRRRARTDAQLQSRLQAIAGIVRLVSSTLDREKLLVEILRWIQGEIDAESSSLLLMEEDGRHLRFEVALGDKGAMLEDFHLEVGKGIAGTVALEKEPVIVHDVHRDERWAQDIADAIDYQTQSILCVPMMLHDKVTGVIEVINKRGGRFTERDVQLATVIAQQAAFFLENARLYRELADRVDFANEELQETNQRLAAEMARISTLLDGMGDGVIGTDGRDHIVLLNDVAEEMFGLREQDVLGQSILAAVDRPGLVELFAMPLSPRGGSYETEILLDAETGQVVRAHVALVDEPGGQTSGKVAVFADITHLKELDRMKMDLITFVSHELKNPIGALQLAYDRLSRQLAAPDERTTQVLGIARRQSGRMQCLVQDFLDLSRIEAGQSLELAWSEISDPAQLIQSAVELSRPGGPEHAFETEVADDIAPFWADRSKMESVLINLLENATKYSPDGGTVTVRAFPTDCDMVFEVQDQGVGIREADLPKLFRSFQRVHDSSFGRVSGTGVGLYVCRHIVEAHGGSIEVESAWGAGSTFRFSIPQRASPSEEDQATAGPEG